MIHLSTTTPERFSALATDPADDLTRLRAAIERGAVDPAHLLIATRSGDPEDHSRATLSSDAADRQHAGSADGAGTSADVGRVGLYRAGDGTMLTYRWLVSAAGITGSAPRNPAVPTGPVAPTDPAAPTDPGPAINDGPGPGLEAVHRSLADGIAELARRDGLAPAYTVVVDADEDDPAAKRRALLATGWETDDDRLELEALPRKRPRGTGIEEISPFDDAVIAVMSAAMSDSTDGYDVEQVQALGAPRAAVAYRDMMADGETPWLAHRGEHGIDGIAAIQRYPTDWCLGYLGVAPKARGQGVGKALATAMVSATAEAGIGAVTASVAVGNPAIRATLDGVGFTIRSARTDFVIRPAG